MKTLSNTFSIELSHFNSQSSVISSLPTKFKLFKFGENESSKGIFVLDEDSLKSILDDYKKKDRELSIDWDHESMEEVSPNPSESKAAAGWFDMEMDSTDNSLWAINVKWVPKAKQKLLDGEFKYISPTFTVDENNRILKIINAALTINPALYGQKKLIEGLKEKIIKTENNVVAEKKENNLIVKNNQKVSQQMTETLELENAELKKKLEDMETSQKLANKQIVDVMMVTAIKERRIETNQRTFLEKMAESQGVQTLKDYLEKCPSKGDLTVPLSQVSQTVEAQETLDPRKDYIKNRQLSELEKGVALRWGLSEKEFNKNILSLNDVKVTNRYSVSGKIDCIALDRKKNKKGIK